MLNYKDRTRLLQIEAYYKEWHILPTFQEMADMFVLSKGGVHKLMQRYVEGGFFTKRGRRYIPVIRAGAERATV